MKILWVGDACVSSGFAKVTHTVCDHLHASGHEVYVLGINYRGDPHSYPYTVYPCMNPFDGGSNFDGSARLPILTNRLNPDVVVILQDPWNIPGYITRIKQANLPHVPPIIGYLAVDALNQRGAPLNDLSHITVWTKFAGEELIKGGYRGNYSVAPLGVDTNLFYPRDRAESRKLTIDSWQLFPDYLQDAYIVGVVGRNQPRKRLDLSIAYFADWVHTYNIDNAYLYLYVAPTGDVGCDIPSLVMYHGLKGRVILTEPHVGHGNSEQCMPHIFSAFDVVLSTTQGEGWGLCTLESMACGVPNIVPDWSGLGDWAKSAAILSPCTSTALSAPINGLAYTIGGVPDRYQTVNLLHHIYQSEPLRRMHSKLGVDLAETLPWSNTAAIMRQVIEDVVAANQVPPPLPEPELIHA